MTRNQMPVLFIGHGSPMNGVADTSFTRALTRLGNSIPTPRAVLCVSAHWETQGTEITGMESPKTIHDFDGFPPELFAVRYPAQGSPQLASEIKSQIPKANIAIDSERWGLDHGAWAVLKFMYPKADVPILQLSLSRTLKPAEHYELGRSIQFLRAQEVLILGSGNIVHNLRTIDWNERAKPYDWAFEFDEWVKAKVLKRDHGALVGQFLEQPSGKKSVPTLEHYLPFLYCLGASADADTPQFEYESIDHGSISMRAVSWQNRN